MDDEELASIETDLRGFARSIGAPDITDDRHYRRRDGSEGEEILLPVRERVVAQLAAFERYFALYDRSVYARALGQLQNVTEPSPDTGSFPESAVVVIPDRTSAELTQTFSFEALPNLLDMRARLQALARFLTEA